MEVLVLVCRTVGGAGGLSQAQTTMTRSPCYVGSQKDDVKTEEDRRGGGDVEGPRRWNPTLDNCKYKQKGPFGLSVCKVSAHGQPALRQRGLVGRRRRERREGWESCPAVHPSLLVSLDSLSQLW